MKHYPPRVTPDLYSNDLAKEICIDLELTSINHQEDFKETLEHGAISFLKKKHDNKVRFTKKQEEIEIKKLAEHFKKSREAYERISNSSQNGQFRLFNSLRNYETNHTTEKKALLEGLYDGFFQNPSFISNILELLEKSALEAIAAPQFFSKSNKTGLVLGWLWSFSDFWEAHSDIKITEGRRGDNKNISHAMTILEKISAPINATLSTKDHITNSQITEAIKIHRQLKKEGFDFNPYIDNQEE